jgi:hypothetical protein
LYFGRNLGQNFEFQDEVIECTHEERRVIKQQVLMIEWHNYGKAVEQQIGWLLVGQA